MWVLYIVQNPQSRDIIFFDPIKSILLHLRHPDSVFSHSACSFSGHKHYFLQQIEPPSDKTPPGVFRDPGLFGDGPGKWTALTKHGGPNSLNWSCSSQWKWLITGQLATGTRANTGSGCECMQLKWESLPLCSLTVLMTFPLLFLCLQFSAYTAKDSLRAKTINYAFH